MEEQEQDLDHPYVIGVLVTAETETQDDIDIMLNSGATPLLVTR